MIVVGPHCQLRKQWDLGKVLESQMELANLVYMWKEDERHEAVAIEARILETPCILKRGVVDSQGQRFISSPLKPVVCCFFVFPEIRYNRLACSDHD